MSGARRRTRQSPGRLESAVGAIGAWVISQALVGTTPERLFVGVCRKLQDAGFGLRRASLSISTLHPMLEARGYVWRQGRGLTAEPYPHGSQASAR